MKQICYVCEVGGCESSKILKVTTDKEVAKKWKRKYGRIVNKLEAMRNEWRSNHYENGDFYTRINRYSLKYSLNFDSSYAIVERYELE